MCIFFRTAITGQALLIPFISGAFSNTVINPVSVMKSTGGSVEKSLRKDIEKYFFQFLNLSQSVFVLEAPTH